MDDRGVERETVDAARDAVIEPHAEREDEIGLVNRQVCGLPAVHADHAEEAGIAGRRAAEPVDGRGVRHLEQLHQLAEHGSCVRAARAAADHCDGSLCGCDQRDRLFERGRVGSLVVRGDGPRCVRVERRALRLEDVVGDVDQHGAGARAAGDAEGVAQHAFEVVHVAYADGALGRRPHDRGDVGLLEGVGPHEHRADLARDCDHRDGVHIGVEDAGHEVRGPWPGGPKANADFSRRAGKAAGREGRALLVPRQDVFDLMTVKGVVQRHDGAAGIPEDDLDALIGEDIEDEL